MVQLWKKSHSPDPLTLKFNKNELLEEITSVPDGVNVS